MNRTKRSTDKDQYEQEKEKYGQVVRRRAGLEKRKLWK